MLQSRGIWAAGMSELTSLVVRLRGERAAMVPLAHGELLQACFLRRLVEPLDADLARRLHDGAGAHPYTVSPLQGDFEVTAAGLRIAVGLEMSWRITGLDATVGAALERVAAQLPPQLLVGPAPLRPLRAELNGVSEAHQLSYEQLWTLVEAQAGAAAVRLMFLTPASFHAQWRNAAPAADITLPVPHLVFASLWHRWRRFAPRAQVERFATARVEAFLDQLTLGAFDLRSATDRFRKSARTGFLGWCEFRLAQPDELDFRVLLRLLAEFSFFAGVGRGTGYGSGQTRPLPPGGGSAA